MKNDIFIIVLAIYISDTVIVSSIKQSDME